MDIWLRLFDSSGFMPRRICGDWSSQLIWLHNASDFFIWTAYLAIPIVLVRFAYRRRQELPFRQVFWLFGLFILACGTTHLMDIVLFYNPLYRLSGAIKLVTAAASWGTVIALVPIVPRALAMRSPEVLQREVDEREKAEAEVRSLNEELRVLNADLEQRVRERTAQLDELLVREQQARAEAEKAREEAESANRAKDEFLAVVSHELRTPLNAMVGWTALLRTGSLDAATQQEALAVIERSTKAQTTIIEDILDVSRIVTGKLSLDTQPVELAPVIEAALKSVRAAAQAKNIRLEVVLEEHIGPVMGDPDRLQQVVWNLASNAIKFTQPDGWVEIGLRRNGTQAEIVVRDNGRGIEPEFLPYVFDRFRQADSSSTRVYGGLGLGLSIVRHVVEMHGGTVQAHSAGEGRGSTFTVSLPLLAEPASAPTATSSAAKAHNASTSPQPSPRGMAGRLSGIKVLAVDDDEGTRSVLQATLGLHGAQVKIADSAREALDVFAHWIPDVLVSDIGMPQEDGYALIAKVRALPLDKGGWIPAVALTAFATLEDQTRAIEAGFQMHISKPVDPEALVAAIVELALPVT